MTRPTPDWPGDLLLQSHDRHHFLATLAEGWELPFVVEPMPRHHGVQAAEQTHGAASRRRPLLQQLRDSLSDVGADDPKTAVVPPGLKIPSCD